MVLAAEVPAEVLAGGLAALAGAAPEAAERAAAGKHYKFLLLDFKKASVVQTLLVKKLILKINSNLNRPRDDFFWFFYILFIFGSFFKKHDAGTDGTGN